MNLRKTFLALGAMILGVGFFGASPAQATPGPDIFLVRIPAKLFDNAKSREFVPLRFLAG